MPTTAAPDFTLEETSLAGRSGPIGVGFVGLGSTRGWARQAHLPALAMLDGFAVRGAVASTPASAKAVAHAHGIPFATDRLEALLERDEIDLVVVTLRVPEHRHVVAAALQAGKAVLCEWPLARHVDEAIELQTLATQARRQCFVGLQARSSPALRFVADLITQGRLGQVLSTSLIADGGAPWGRPSIEQRQLMYQDESNGATMLTIPFGHLLDALQQLFGPLHDRRSLLAVRQPQTLLRDTGEPIEVSAPDQVCVSGLCDRGVVANLHYRTGFRSGTRLHWEINGTEGTLMMRSDCGHFQFGRIELEASFGIEPPASLPIPASYWPLTSDRESLAYNVALAYAAIRRDLQDGTCTAPNVTDAIALHRTLASIQGRPN